MVMSGLILPEKIDFEKSEINERYGRFVAEPFERGYGSTIGNGLRRVLLSSLEGSAVTSVRVKGAPHEFTALRGIREDVLNIILNLKQLRLRLFSAESQTLHLKVKHEGAVKAKEITHSDQVEVLNPDLVIAHLDSGAELDMEIIANRGRGYLPVEKQNKEALPIGYIGVDSLFSPVVKVHYEVENARVGQMTDYDKLILEVWTDGSLTPTEALGHAAKIFKDAMSIFINFEEVEDTPSVRAPLMTDEDHQRKDLLSQPVEIIELSQRAANCLKAAKIHSLHELVAKNREELLSYRNFGQKSLQEIHDRLKELGLDLGMDLSEKETAS